jgi:phage head maturation protease
MLRASSAPAALNRIDFTASVELTAAAGAGKRPTFKIHAYDGSPMTVASFYTPVIVDLAGLKAARSKLPILMNHDPEKPIGQADSITIDAKTGIDLAGTITGDDEAAQTIITHARNGFEWQASIGASIQRREFLEAGKTTTVNGRTVTGPLLIARAATLIETSFVSIGADSQSSVAIAAKKGPQTMLQPNTSVASETPTVTTDLQRIEALCSGDWTAAQKPHIAELRGRAILGEIDAAELNAGVLEIIRASRPNIGAKYINSGSGSPGVPDRVIAEAGLLALCGYESAASKLGNGVALEAAHDLGLTNLRAWDTFNQRVTGDSTRQIQASGGFSTASLGVLMSSVPKMMLAEFEQAPASCDALADWKAVPDFKEQSMYRLLVKGGLEEVGGDGEIKHGSLSEFSTRIALGTYGRLFTITRKALVNDDAGALATIPRVLVMEAARLRGEKFAALLTANPDSFFSESNGNTIADALSTAGLNAALVALRTQTDADGRALNLAPFALLVPPALESTARQLLANSALMRDQTSDAQPTGNPFTSLNLRLAIESRLPTTTEWYLTARPSDSAIVVGTLNAQRVPIVEQPNAGANVLGQVIRGYYDFAIALCEPRAIVRSTGAGD